MKITEFRIGNLLQCQSDNLLMVSNLDIQGDTIGFDVIDRSKFPLPDGWKASGIPLTKEILKRAGFSEKGYRYGFIGIDINSGGVTTDFVLTYPGVLGPFQKYFAFDFEVGRLPKFVQFEYLHQLQNFFFVMTGEELTVNVS